MSHTQKLALFNIDSEQKLGPSIKAPEKQQFSEDRSIASGDTKWTCLQGKLEDDKEAETMKKIMKLKCPLQLLVDVYSLAEKGIHIQATKHYEELEDKIKAIEACGLIFLDKVRDRVTTQQQDQLQATVENVTGLSCVANAVGNDVKSAMTSGVTMDIEDAVQGSNNPEKDDCEVSMKSYSSTVNVGLDLTAYNQACTILPHDLADN
ncbi:hypothetical protein BDQ17DRAFT_1436551 [Cyathus striatus]|nr:hypothetical protein BDQ17DRAFT_1436551 [Cyathus striatus]